MSDLTLRLAAEICALKSGKCESGVAWRSKFWVSSSVCLVGHHFLLSHSDFFFLKEVML